MTTRMTLSRRTGWRRVAVLTVAAAAAVTLAACSSSGSTNSGGGGGGGGGSDTTSSGSNSMPGKGKPTFIMGDKNFDEEYLLGDMYQKALELAGYTIQLKPNLGSSEIADKLLSTGKIDGLPEYTGVIYTELANKGDQPKSAAVTLAGATAYEKANGVSVLDPTPFQDKDGVAVNKSYASAHNLKTIADLKNVGSFTYGGPPENRTRYQGVVGLKEAYGLNQIQFKPLSIGSQYTALDENKVDSIAIFTTDGQLASGKYAVLTDTKNIFGFQQVVPIIKTAKLNQMGPAFSTILNNLDKLLSTSVIIALNKAVQIDKQDPATVAAAFVNQNKSAILAGI